MKGINSYKWRSHCLSTANSPWRLIYAVQSRGWIYRIAVREQWGLAGSRAGVEMAAGFNVVRQIHGAEAGWQSRWKVRPQVITRPTEGQSPAITGDGLRQKPDQEFRSTGAQARTEAPRLILIKAPACVGQGSSWSWPGLLRPISVFKGPTIVTLSKLLSIAFGTD